MSPSRRHEMVVQQLKRKYPGFKIKGFSAALKRHVDKGVGAYVRPDGYRINRKTKTIKVYEVEITSRLTDEKMDRWSETWFGLDDQCWFLDMTILNAYGKEIGKISDHEWESWFYKKLWGLSNDAA